MGIKAELHAEFLAGAAEGIAQELRPFMESKLTSLIRQSATQARSDVPVKTGTLGRSIREEPIVFTSPLVAEGGISANTHYAAFVHDGTRFMAARPFLLNAAERVIARETA